MVPFPVTVILLLAGVCFQLFGSSPAAGQEPTLDGNEGRDLLLRNFRPVPTLKVSQHLLKQARFPVVDIHTHFFHRLKHSADQLDHFVELMNRHNIAVCASLDAELADSLRFLHAAAAAARRGRSCSPPGASP